MRWLTPCSPDWVRKSECGHYGIAIEKGSTRYDAYHIEALWATPEVIDDAPTIEAAQAICESHFRRTPAHV